MSCREHRRTVVDCCRRPCARAPRCTERVGESRSHFCGDGCFLAPHGCKRWSRARFLSRVPRSPLCFSCAHRRVAVARAVVREAKRQQRRRRSVRGWWEGAGTTKRGATAPKSCFFLSIPARLCAFSDSGRWQLRVAAGYGHRARRQGHFGAWVCLLGSWGWFRPLSAVAGPAELAFLVKALFLNFEYDCISSWA